MLHVSGIYTVTQMNIATSFWSAWRNLTFYYTKENFGAFHSGFVYAGHREVTVSSFLGKSITMTVVYSDPRELKGHVDCGRKPVLNLTS